MLPAGLGDKLKEGRVKLALGLTKKVQFPRILSAAKSAELEKC